MLERVVVTPAWARTSVRRALCQKSRQSFLTQFVERKGKWRARGDSNSRPDLRGHPNPANEGHLKTGQ